jgi:hypothetical protein
VVAHVPKIGRFLLRLRGWWQGPVICKAAVRLRFIMSAFTNGRSVEFSRMMEKGFGSLVLSFLLLSFLLLSFFLLSFFLPPFLLPVHCFFHRTVKDREAAERDVK